jgi:hypothetical protein
LNSTKDQLWILKQCKEIHHEMTYAKLWYSHDMDAIWDWLAHWEFCMTACAIPQFALWYGEVIRWTKRDQALSTCTYSNSTMVYAEVMRELCELIHDDGT